MSAPEHYCLACGKEDLGEALDLGLQPLANDLSTTHNPAPASYPLKLNYCPNCSHAQLSYFAMPEVLFSHYLYASGTSKSLASYFDWFALECTKLKKPGAKVLEIASNDGSLLEKLTKTGYVSLGVDPAQNLAKIANDKGCRTLCAFWPDDRVNSEGPFDVIVGQNVLAHNPDPLAFLEGVKRALAADGICLIQTSQAHMLQNGEFDTIYHEHYSFFSFQSMQALVARAGLRLAGAVLTAIHGDSQLFFITHADRQETFNGAFSTTPFGLPAKAADTAIRSPVEIRKLFSEFANKARTRMASVQKKVDEFRARNYPICFIGAAAKAIVFLNASGIQPDHIYDEAVLKIGKYIPGINAPIESLTAIANLKEPSLIVISAWNFKTELERKIRALAPGVAHSFLCYFPELEVFA